MTFPLNLTTEERQCVEAFVKTGERKRVEVLTHKCERTVRLHLCNAARKAGVKNDVLMALAYQRATL